MLRASCYNESHTVVARAGGYIKRTSLSRATSTSEYINDVLVLYFTTPLPLGISANIPGACEKLNHTCYQPDVKYNIPYSRVN